MNAFTYFTNLKKHEIMLNIFSRSLII